MTNNFFPVSAFEVVPKPVCIPCGESAEFNCSTRYLFNSNGTLVDIVGGQLWRIQTPNGTVTNVRSTNLATAMAPFKFINSQYKNEYTGLRVTDTDLTWNGTTFQCIAYASTNLSKQNDSAPAVTLKVEGGCRICFICGFTILRQFCSC